MGYIANVTCICSPIHFLSTITFNLNRQNSFGHQRDLVTLAKDHILSILQCGNKTQ